MDIFDIIGTTPPEVSWCITCLFVMCFTLVVGAVLVHVAVKHGRVVERKEALELKRRKWWEEIQ